MINVTGWFDHTTYGSCQECKDHVTASGRWAKRHRVFVFTVMGTQVRLCAKALDRFKQEFADKIETAE